MINILIDGHMINDDCQGGNARYTSNLYKSIKSISSNRFKVWLYKKSWINNDWLRLLIYLPFKIWRCQIDVVHSNYIAPIIKSCKQVIIVHDLYFRRAPKSYSLKDKFIFYCLLPWSLKQADAIITPSKFTKKELLNYYPQYRSKTYVTYEGVDSCFKYQTKFESISILNKLVNVKFLLTINSSNPKKNINSIIKAFLMVNKKQPDIKLVIVGGSDNIKNIYKDHKDILIYQYISDDKLNWLYNHCQIFISYSLYEGFNLPIFEAMKCRSPIIMSDISVNREVTNNQLIYTPTTSYHYLANQINKIINKRLTNYQKKQYYMVYNRFSWAKCARQTLKIFNKITKL